MFCSIAPVDVVVVLVVTAECNKRTDTEAVREEDLRHCINPHLREIVFIALINLFICYKNCQTRLDLNEPRDRAVW